MGNMEFGVVRNNHYQISISSIADVGTGEPALYNEQADETDESLVVDLSVTSY